MCGVWCACVVCGGVCGGVSVWCGCVCVVCGGDVWWGECVVG